MLECQSAAPETINFIMAKWPTGTSCGGSVVKNLLPMQEM